MPLDAACSPRCTRAASSGVNNDGVGAQDTDTLILVHIFAGGQKAVGFSIPRDDLVTYPKAYYDGITTGKIDQAYYFAYVSSLNSTYGSSMSSERALPGGQPGRPGGRDRHGRGGHRRSTVNNYVVMNLAGFYRTGPGRSAASKCASRRRQ